MSSKTMLYKYFVTSKIFQVQGYLHEIIPLIPVRQNDMFKVK